MYVTSVDHIINKGSVWVIDTNTNTVVGPPIGVPIISAGIAFDPTHNRMYVTIYDPITNNGGVSVIDTNTNTVVG
jgi:DNA-binding beta-propeller fold protein YncE